jgi:hypothetical protein
MTVLASLGLSPEKVRAMLGAAAVSTGNLPPKPAKPAKAEKPPKPPKVYVVKRFSDAQIQSMRERIERGDRLAAVAFDFDTSVPLVCRIARGNSYRHAPGPITQRSRSANQLAQRHVSSDAVLRMRLLATIGNVKIARIAKDEGLPFHTAALIIHGKTYVDCPGPITKPRGYTPPKIQAHE